MVIGCDVWLILIVGFGGCCWCCVGFEFGFVCLLFLACGLLIGAFVGLRVLVRLYLRYVLCGVIWVNSVVRCRVFVCAQVIVLGYCLFVVWAYCYCVLGFVGFGGFVC